MRNEQPSKVIFDTDPGIDDAMAILFAHLSPQIDLVGITSVFGNAPIEKTTNNACYLRDRFDLNCGVYCGAAQPLYLPLGAAPTFVHGHDGLGDTGQDIPEVSRQPDAIQFIIETIRTNPGDITIVAVGRMTNLATALTIAPDIAALTKRVVIMGGVTGLAGIGGNVTPVAEANIYGDPHAADIIMRAAWDLTMVGLDVTMKTLISPERMQVLAEKAGEIGQFIYEVSRYYQSFYQSRTGSESFPVHDALALVYLVNPALFQTHRGAIRVLTEGDGLGQTVFASADRAYPEAAWTEERPHQRVCLGVDSESAMDLYQDTMLRSDS